MIPSSEALNHATGDYVSAQTTTVNSLQQRAADLSESPLTIGTGTAYQAPNVSGDRNSQ